MLGGLLVGGTQGIGPALAQSCLVEGWRIVMLDRDAEALSELTAELVDSSLLGLAADVGEEAAVAAVCAASQTWPNRAGEPAGLNLPVNNAGLADPVSGPLEALSLAGWRHWLDGHLTGAFPGTRGAIPGLRTRRGAIVRPNMRSGAWASLPTSWRRTAAIAD